MKKYLKACLMAMTMFCAIPMPYHKWDDEQRPLMTICLPVVGLEIGLIWGSIYYVLRVLIAAKWFPIALAACVFAVYPFIVTGFMHLDGFMDVTDALRSYRDIDERRRILKDSHVGAFSVISVIILFLVNYSAALSLDYQTESFYVLICLPIITRCCSAIAVSTLPPMETSQFAGKYQDNVKNSQLVFLVATIFIVSLIATILSNLYGLVIVAALMGYFINVMKGYRRLEGMNGDIAGYALVKAETWGIVAFALIGPLTDFYKSIL